MLFVTASPPGALWYLLGITSEEPQLPCLLHQELLFPGLKQPACNSWAILGPFWQKSAISSLKRLLQDKLWLRSELANCAESSQAWGSAVGCRHRELTRLTNSWALSPGQGAAPCCPPHYPGLSEGCISHTSFQILLSNSEEVHCKAVNHVLRLFPFVSPPPCLFLVFPALHLLLVLPCWAGVFNERLEI